MLVKGKLTDSFSPDEQICEVVFTHREIIIYKSGTTDIIESWPREKSVCEESPAGKIYSHRNKKLTLDHSCVHTCAFNEETKPSKKNRKIVFITLAGIGVFLLLVIGGIFYAISSSLPWLTDRVAMLIPIETEVSMGEKIALAYEPKGENSQLDSLDKYMQAFTTAMSIDTKYPLRVNVIKSDEINAFALPGGRIFIYTGLLEKLGSSEELAALIGHEASHVIRRHSLKSLLNQAAVGVLFSALFGDVGGLGSWVVSKAEEFKQLDYSRDLETEADLAGLEIMANSDIDPQGMLRLLSVLQSESKSEPSLMKYFSTHPETEERIRSVNSAIQQYNQFSQSSKLDHLFDLIRHKAAAVH